jgi:hypothetical protein
MSDDKFIERRIITGMIVSSGFLRSIQEFWDPKYLESSSAKLIASWCIEYFNKYNRAPKRDIEGIFTRKLKSGLKDKQAEGVELILQGLSTEYTRKKFNQAYLVDETIHYFQERRLKDYAAEIQDQLDRGSLIDAEKTAISYSPIIREKHSAVNPFEDSERVKRAFQDQAKPLIKFPKTFGYFINSQFTRDSFVAFMGPEKIGKTFILIEVAMTAIKSGCNVAFFQAGDMSEGQMIKRLYIWLTEKSDQKRYCKEIVIPIVDCVLNQNHTCKRKEREHNRHAIFNLTDKPEKRNFAALSKAFTDNPKHKPCSNCKEQFQGAIWFKIRPAVEPLTWKEGYKEARKFIQDYPNQFRLATYPNETLTMADIKTLLDTWEREEIPFVPDVIIVDYLDIMAPDADLKKLDNRNQQNKIWQRARRLSQQKHCLFVTATQAAASSYDHEVLQLKDFSETKTKYAHVTAMYGLNQTGDEKKIGIIRLNELVLREGDFDRSSQIKVLQRLQMGRPFLGSYR